MRVLAVVNDWPTPEFPGAGSHMRQLLSGIEEVGVRLEVFFINRLADGARVYLSAAKRLRERIEQARFDAVHVTYGGILAERVTSQLRDYPTLVTFCGSDLLGENRSGHLRKAVSRLGVIASYRAARLATGVIVQSANLAEALPKDVERAKVRIIPNGVDLDRFKPLDRDECCRRLGWHQDRFHVLFSRNGGDPVKRLDLAETAVDRLNAWGISSELHLLERVPHDEVPIWLNACDSLVLTSQHEGSPNIVKEALACNRPVVFVDVGDVAERVRGIEGCYLVPRETAGIAMGLRRVHEGQRRVKGREKMAELSLKAASHRIRKFYTEAVDRFGSQN